MAIIILAIVLVRLIAALIPVCNEWLHVAWHKIQKQLKKQKSAGLFDEHFIEAKAFYMKEFKSLPCIMYIANIDANKIFQLIISNKYGGVKETYQRNWYNWQQERLEFSKTIFKIDRKMSKAGRRLGGNIIQQYRLCQGK